MNYCSSGDRIVIIKGDDTNFNGQTFLSFVLRTNVLDLSTFKATFALGGIIKTFDDISSGRIEINYTASETSSMPSGKQDGTLRLIDGSGRAATIESLIPFDIQWLVHGDSIATKPSEITINVEQGGQTILDITVEAGVSVEVGETTTLPPGSNAYVENVGTTNHLILNFGIPEGNGILNIEKTSTNILVDTYTITYTDGSNSTFEVTNGRGIDSIEKIGTEGLVDTYKILYNNNTYSTFEVTNGRNATINGHEAISLNAGTGIAITDDNGVITIDNTNTSAEWGNITGNIENQSDLSNALAGKQNRLTTPQMSAVNSGITASKVTSYDSHIVNTTIHVTAQDKQSWNAKQNALTNDQLDAVNSGITSSGVSQIQTNKEDIAQEIINRGNADSDLQDQINNLKARGRFLALWNCSTGLAETNPPQSPYTYQTGDYFIIGTVASGGGTNYRPSGSTYTTGVASTTVETQQVDIDDVYYYDGTNWHLQVNTQKTVSFDNIAGNPYDNSALTTALNAKQNTLSQGTGITISNNTVSVNFSNVATAAQGTKADTAIQPTNAKFQALNVQYVESGTPSYDIDLGDVYPDQGEAPYGFYYDGDYLVSDNMGVDESYAYAKIYLDIDSDTTVRVYYSQDSETNYDYGIISNLDEELNYDKQQDYDYAWCGNEEGSQSGYVEYNVSAGSHFFTVKYIKDMSEQSGDDCLRITRIEVGGGFVSKLVDYDTQEDIPAVMKSDIATSVGSSSTNEKVVGAQLFYETCGDIETLINAL